MIPAKPPAKAERGHNSKVKAGPVVAGRLKSFVERIEKLRGEKKAIGEDERDVFSEAKGVGYDAPTIRWLLKERELDAADRDERDALRDTYAHALGMAVSMVQVEGLSLRQAEAATGISKSSIQRALAVPEVSQVEMTEGDLGAFPPTEHSTTAVGEKGHVVNNAIDTVNHGGSGDRVGDGGDGPDAGGVVADRAAQPDCPDATHAAAPEPQGTPRPAEPSLVQRILGTFDDPLKDDLEFPPHLKRKPEGVPA